MILFGEDRSPFSKGLSIGWRLAIMLSIVVGISMGIILLIEQREQDRLRESLKSQLLDETLRPAAAILETARSMEQVQAFLQTFRSIYRKSPGGGEQYLGLVDRSGRPLAETPRSALPHGTRYLAASVPVRSALFAGGQATLVIWETKPQHQSAPRQRDYSGWLHWGLTVLAILLAVHVTVYFLIIRPLGQLMHGIRLMELGYWSDIHITGGAWEFQMLVWKFRSAMLLVQRNVKNLIAAERRAHDLLTGTKNDSAPARPVETPPATVNRQDRKGKTAAELVNLESKFKSLRALDPKSPQAIRLAQEVWEYDAIRAEFLGDPPLKNQLENLALSILEPEEYDELRKQLAEIKATDGSLYAKHKQILLSQLKKYRIPVIHIEYRFKHAAGVWRKLQAQNLQLAQVYDLFAFRVVVPSISDCYSALGAVHEIFPPVVGKFKDYIASPKANGYQSLHTCVKPDNGRIFEVQIRTAEMHEQAERASSAHSHWQYKLKQARLFPRPSRWLRRIRSWVRQPPSSGHSA